MVQHTIIMRDYHHGHPFLKPEVHQDIEHPRLNAEVQRRHRLIQNENIRLYQERPGNCRTLPLPSREKTGTAVEERGVESYRIHRLMQHSAGFPGKPVCPTPSGSCHTRFPQGDAYGQTRVEGLQGILEDHLHSPGVHPGRNEPRSLKIRIEPHKNPREGCLSCTGTAANPKNCVPVYLKRHTAQHGVLHTLTPKGTVHVAQLKDCGVIHCAPREKNNETGGSPAPPMAALPHDTAVPPGDTAAQRDTRFPTGPAKHLPGV